MILATWNIREFDSATYAARDIEPLYNIAEILSHFDLIAISRLMDGERKPLFGFNRKKALPYFLERGWNIRSVHINEKSHGHKIYGYVVVERMISPYNAKR